MASLTYRMWGVPLNFKSKGRMQKNREINFFNDILQYAPKIKPTKEIVNRIFS